MFIIFYVGDSSAYTLNLNNKFHHLKAIRSKDLVAATEAVKGKKICFG